MVKDWERRETLRNYCFGTISGTDSDTSVKCLRPLSERSLTLHPSLALIHYVALAKPSSSYSCYNKLPQTWQLNMQMYSLKVLEVRVSKISLAESKVWVSHQETPGENTLLSLFQLLCHLNSSTTDPLPVFKGHHVGSPSNSNFSSSYIKGTFDCIPGATWIIQNHLFKQITATKSTS